MRGKRPEQQQLFSYVALEDRVPPNHPLRTIRRFVEPMLRELSAKFDEIYSHEGRPSIPPEQLILAFLLQGLYSVRSERMLCEQLQYNLLFRWFVGLELDARIWDPSVFSKNRDRLLDGGIAHAFLKEVEREARRRGWVSDEHFTVDGTLLDAWASHKSFQPKDEPPGGPGGSNPSVDFHGERRSNDTHQSRTDPEARLARKGSGKEAKLSFQANVLMENRNGLIIDTEVRPPSGTSEREAALAMLDRLRPSTRRRTVGADKGYDTQDFVREVRARDITPHVAQNNRNRRSAIDGRTTSHEGYQTSQRKRKLVEQGFGWAKVVGNLGKLHHRGLRLASAIFAFTMATYNLVRMRTLLEEVCP